MFVIVIACVILQNHEPIKRKTVLKPISFQDRKTKQACREAPFISLHCSKNTYFVTRPVKKQQMYSSQADSIHTAVANVTGTQRTVVPHPCIRYLVL